MIISTTIPPAQYRPITPSYDFGTVSALDHPKVFHDFVFTNTGNAPEVIDRLQPSCHCTSGMVLPESSSTLPIGTVGQTLPITVPVGGSVKVREIIDLTEDPAGPVDKSLGVYLQGQNDLAAMFLMSGQVTPDLTVTPRIVDFGNQEPGKPTSIKVSVTIDKRLCPSGFPVFSSNNEDLKIDPSPIVDTVQPGNPGRSPAHILSRTYIVSPSSNMPLGAIQGSLALVPPSDDPSSVAPEFQSVVAVVTGTVLGPVHAHPDALSFGTVLSGQGATQEITLDSNNLSDVTHVKAVSRSLYITVTPGAPDASTSGVPAAAPTASHHVFLEVKIDRKAPTGLFNSEIKVVLADGHRLLIPVTGYVTALPQ